MKPFHEDMYSLRRLSIFISLFITLPPRKYCLLLGGSLPTLLPEARLSHPRAVPKAAHRCRPNRSFFEARGEGVGITSICICCPVLRILNGNYRSFVIQRPVSKYLLRGRRCVVVAEDAWREEAG